MTQITCTCRAYPFPHREGGGKCEMPDWCGEDDACFFDDYNEACNTHTPNERNESLTIAERNPNWRNW